MPMGRGAGPIAAARRHMYSRVVMRKTSLASDPVERNSLRRRALLGNIAVVFLVPLVGIALTALVYLLGPRNDVTDALGDDMTASIPIQSLTKIGGGQAFGSPHRY
jgi:hypothetical protein